MILETMLETRSQNMKLNGRFVGTWAALFAASLVLSSQAQTQDGCAEVKAIKGSADFSEGGGTWSKLRVGKLLYANAVIRTADGSEVDLSVKKNGPVRLMPNTTLGLTKLLLEDTGAETVIDTQLDLKAGRVLGEVAKMAISSRYEVKTSTSVVGIRGTGEGTKYDISANGKVVMLEGWAMVVFADSSGKTTTHRVDASRTFDPATQTPRDATDQEVKDVKDNLPPAYPAVTIPQPQYVQPFVSPISPSDSVNVSSTPTDNHGGE
jgi:hypothetical protein